MSSHSKCASSFGSTCVYVCVIICVKYIDFFVSVRYPIEFRLMEISNKIFKRSLSQFGVQLRVFKV